MSRTNPFRMYKYSVYFGDNAKVVFQPRNTMNLIAAKATNTLARGKNSRGFKYEVRQ